ncbi:cytochrome c maturation protein CcmE [Candidatus Desulfovibrio trichonymphae]|uniref:Cytochrome c-type biogenesis protein, heme chaperon CcmE n=1 Tax=Candidatus Desulfovibrio trichonymphae TaxID=1725232 RepID=A0A1J1E328_9BACT|nr:cytochrome c maturation protein CcmE [Candidatus Desulfovibrio trichonymphae]BAV92299.1 cytochrome c-type biogenesis protein, heme chaperon CcmE [Candidatus Desulfovibrio trichonymphae]GHU98196.1 cytochrome C biogenesis protein CcmE [Deltaproteobacteria bacterium]
MARNPNTSLYLVALLLFAGGGGYLIHSGFSENSVYFLNVAEAKAASPDKLTRARLFGTVAQEGIAKHRTGAGVTFCLEDRDNAGQTIVISYSGAVPDTFKAGAEVIVEGGLGQEGRFMAKTLMTKCPSKYQKESRKS